ncbi:hypothetical protein VNO77_23331 [Canavalia gladiata]|uniref:Uncharacterized protein n=1 Tax=Canavalia gladiata TaxID=3824 RepID=A0AAN9QBE7_CANGL
MLLPTSSMRIGIIFFKFFLCKCASRDQGFSRENERPYPVLRKSCQAKTKTVILACPEIEQKPFKQICALEQFDLKHRMQVFVSSLASEIRLPKITASRLMTLAMTFSHQDSDYVKGAELPSFSCASPLASMSAEFLQNPSSF